MKNRRSIILALTSLVAAAIVATAVTTPPTRVSAQAPTTPTPNVTQVKALYGEKCSACHNLPDPVEKAYTRQEWQRTVDRMLTKYKASDSISPNEAGQIVTYLATFAPKAPRPGGGSTGNPWDTGSSDVWTDNPSATRVFNFEATDGLAGLSSLAAGATGPAPVWHVIPDKPGPDGNVARITSTGFAPDRFALLVDRGDQAQNLDIRVRFRIDAGKVSPAVGIIFGFTDQKNYTVLRYNQSLGDMALIQIAGPSHTTLQQNPLTLPLPPTPLLPVSTTAPGAPPTTASAPAPVQAMSVVVARPFNPAGWHTLRLLVRDGQVRGWIDMNKRISIAMPNYTGGRVGLWTQGNTTASFDDWTVDLYGATTAAPLS